MKIGLQDKIKIWDGYIIDGHNRYSICKKHNIPISENDVVELKLETKQQAVRWMLSYQLGRRNLSELDRFEIVQKFKNYFTFKAKQNNSNGGKGLTNLSKVNTRKEMAKVVGVSEGTYQKLDKISKSGNEEIKIKVKNKEVSIDKAFKIINDVSSNAETEIRTPKVRIEEIDTRISNIEKEEHRLHQEKQDILKKKEISI